MHYLSLDTYACWHSQSCSHYMFKFAMPVVTRRRPGSLLLHKEAYLPISVTLNCVFTNYVFQNGTAYTLLSPCTHSKSSRGLLLTTSLQIALHCTCNSNTLHSTLEHSYQLRGSFSSLVFNFLFHGIGWPQYRITG